MSPIRVQNNVLFDPDQDESLRAPAKLYGNNVKSSSPFSKVMLDHNEKQMLRLNNQGSGNTNTEQSTRYAHISVIDLLNQQESLDIRFIHAEQLFNDHNYYKSYEVLKKIKDDDPYYVDAILLLCSVLIELDK